MNLAICVVCFNRQAELIKLINCLINIQTKEKIDLCISIDFSSEQSKINEIAISIDWPFGDKKVILHEQNLGLKKHVLSCGDLSFDYDGLIILEDDLIISPYMIDFVTSSLVSSYTDANIAGISLYSYMRKESNKMPFIPYIDSSDSYFVQFPSSWGFVVSPKQWKEFKEWLVNWDCEYFEDNLLPKYICEWGDQSWKKHFVRYMVHTNKYFIYPRFALSTNPGANGTHHKFINSLYSVPLCMGRRSWNVSKFGESQVVYDVNFEPTPKLKGLISETFNDGHISFGTITEVKKSHYIIDNYFLSLSEYFELTAKFFVNNINKLIFKLGFKK